jgi:hypothetical protein
MKTSKKDVLISISQELKNYDFNSFDPRQDKPLLLSVITVIKSKLGKLLREMEK